MPCKTAISPLKKMSSLIKVLLLQNRERLKRKGNKETGKRAKE
jgi:hypothetical protein